MKIILFAVLISLVFSLNSPSNATTTTTTPIDDVQNSHVNSSLIVNQNLTQNDPASTNLSILKVDSLQERNITLKHKVNATTQFNNVTISSVDSSLIVDQDFTLGWKFNNDSTIEFHVSWKKHSWFGLGFGNSMFNTDMVIAQIKGTQLYIQDTYSTSEDYPQVDAQQDLELLYYFINGTEVDFVFKRKLNTGDPQDIVFVQDTTYDFCYAYTVRDEIEEHSSSQYTIFSVPLSIGITGQAQLADDGPSMFMLAHGILFFLIWGVIADIGVFFSRYQKTVNQYMNVHAYCFLIVDVTTIIMVALSLQIFGVDNLDYLLYVHQVIALILLALICFQHTGGVIIKHFLEERTKKNREFALMIRNGHRLLGMTLYLLGKINILIGLYYYPTYILYVLALIWTIFCLIFLIVFEIIKVKNRFVKEAVPVTKLPLKKEHTQLLDLINSGNSRAEILAKLPLTNWVMLNNRVYDLTGLQHPGGNYIYELVKGREIARFFFGAYALESTSQKPHVHSQKAYQLLQSKYIGEVVAPSIVVPIDEDKLANLEQVETFWKKVSQKSISKSVMQFNFEHPANVIKNHQKGVEWFGKHFTIATQEYGAKIRLYTTVVSMNEQNVVKRNKLLGLYDSLFDQQVSNPNTSQKQNSVEIPENYMEHSKQLTFIIKKYNFPNTLSSLLHDTKHDQYIIKGPFGLGLELKQESSGTHTAFVGGTGILPFIDLLDFLLQKAIYMVLQQANHPKLSEIDHLNNNLDSTFTQNFTFHINAAFQNEEEFIGAVWIRRLYQISKTHNLGLFDMALRYSDKSLDSVIPNVTQRFDAEYINKHIDTDKVVKVYVCGPPAMNQAVPAGLSLIGFQAEKILIV